MRENFVSKFNNEKSKPDQIRHKDKKENEIPHAQSVTIQPNVKISSKLKKKEASKAEEEGEEEEEEEEEKEGIEKEDSIQKDDHELEKIIDRQQENPNPNTEMKMPEKKLNNIDVNLIVTSKKEKKTNYDTENVPILNASIRKSSSKKSRKKNAKSTNKNKSFYLNEQVMSNLSEKNKTIVHNLFDKLDFDFIKEKKNKKSYEFDENYYKQLQLEADKLHPREKMKKIPVCKSNTGCMGCCEKYENSDLMKTGLGMVIYFKILKTFGIIFFLVSLFNILLFFVFINSHQELEIKSYQDALFKTTIGNIGSTLYRCEKYNLTNANLFSFFNYELNLNCGDDYTISTAVALGGTVDTAKKSTNEANCISYSNKMSLETDYCNLLPYLDKKMIEAECKGKNSCKLKLGVLEIFKNCTQTVLFNTLYTAYSCYDPLIRLGKIGDKQYNLDRSTFSFITVGIDLLSILTLFISLFIISKSQTITEEKFREDIMKISNFTLHFSNVGLDGEKLNEELQAFYCHLKIVYDVELERKIEKLQDPKNFSNPEIEDRKKKAERLEENLKTKENIIYDINYPLVNQTKLDIILMKNELYGERVKLQYQAEMEKNRNKEKYDKFIGMVWKKKMKEAELDNQYIKNMNTFRKIDDIYVTFYNTEDCEIIRNAYNKSAFKRCCTIFCCNRKKIKHL